MRVNLKSLYAGPLGCYGPGVCDVPDEIALDLIRADVAVAVPVRGEVRAVMAKPPVVETQAPAARAGKHSKPASKSVVSDV